MIFHAEFARRVGRLVSEESAAAQRPASVLGGTNAIRGAAVHQQRSQTPDSVTTASAR